MKFDVITGENYNLIAETYREGILSGHATFETNVPEWARWDATHLTHSRIIGLVDDQYIGWAALSPVSGRCVYGGVAEVSIYLKASQQGKGYGKHLLKQLILESESNGIWTLQAGIFPENVASLSIHTTCGFSQIGIRERIGKMQNGFWRDVCILERRSSKVGTDKKKILVLCTGNSCRSQMAEGYLRKIAGDKAIIYSAGLEAHGLNQLAVKVMLEDGVDISRHTSNTLEDYSQEHFDVLLTVCDHANEHCPVFSSTAVRYHQSFYDPAKHSGSRFY
jgi:thioredoxin type arsenate reductase